MRELISRERFTVTEVAEAIGVKRATIYTWINTAPIDKLYAIAKCIGVPFQEVADCFNPDLHPQTETEPDRN
ncbi:helix-turn-helix domain-containing protein [Chamaesiphon sp.]|uniref:helix-turn-helix domain-containing protein n=1 Tax=Chamaesiphon sp. TaxID=2814140 RepID=UPI003593192C